MYRSKSPPTIASLRKELVADSIERQRLMAKLLQMVREQERADTLGRLADARSKAQSSDR